MEYLLKISSIGNEEERQEQGDFRRGTLQRQMSWLQSMNQLILFPSCYSNTRSLLLAQIGKPNRGFAKTSKPN